MWLKLNPHMREAPRQLTARSTSTDFGRGEGKPQPSSLPDRIGRPALSFASLVCQMRIVYYLTETHRVWLRCLRKTECYEYQVLRNLIARSDAEMLLAQSFPLNPHNILHIVDVYATIPLLYCRGSSSLRASRCARKSQPKGPRNSPRCRGQSQGEVLGGGCE